MFVLPTVVKQTNSRLVMTVLCSCLLLVINRPIVT